MAPIENHSFAIVENLVTVTCGAVGFGSCFMCGKV